MKPDLRGLIVLGLFALIGMWSAAAGAEQAPPEAGATSVEAAPADAAKTGAAKTDAAAKTTATTGASGESTASGSGAWWSTVRGYAVGFLTYPLTIAMAIIIFSYALGRIIGGRLRMPDYSWKIGLVAFTVIASGFITWVGISNAVVRARAERPSGPELKFGIDLRGGVNLIYQIRKGEGESAAVDANALIDALRKRIDPNGTKQIVVRLSGADQVDIVVPAVNQDEIDEIKRNVTDLGTLEFRILANRRDSKHVDLGKLALEQTTGVKKGFRRDEAELVERRDELMRAQLQGELTEAQQQELKQIAQDLARPEALWVPLDPDLVREYYDPQKDADGANLGPVDFARGMFTRALRGNEVLKDVPAADLVEPKPQGGERYKPGYRAEILVYQDPYDVKGDYLSGITAGIDEKANPAVNFAFDAEGSGRFTSLTTEFAPPSTADKFRWHLAVVLNGEVASAPSLNSVINGRGQITGYRNDEQGRKERDRVISVLKSGQLPAQLYETPLREYRLDATLGMDTIRKSVVSMCVALGVVFLFLVFYYRFAGVVACLALLLNFLLVAGAMIAMGAPLTLPGFAGMILSIGMAVDANVLIYERIREEVARGTALRMAIRNGFGKALSAIIDGNVTAILTAIILYAIGTEQLRGFAVTLILGLSFSMFTAVFCSRLIFDIAERQRWLRQVKMMEFFKKTNYDFLAMAKPAIAASLIVILLGFVAVYFRGRGLLDIEFTGGTAAQVVLKDHGESPKLLEDARARLEQWNETIENASDDELPNILELKQAKNKQKLLRTLQIELLASQAADQQQREQADALRRKHHLVGDELSSADLAVLQEFYDSLTPDQRREFRKLARLDDLAVTVTRIGETERRPYVNTSNSSQAAVEGILEKLFEGDLASKGFHMEPLARASTSSGSGPTTKQPGGKEAGAGEAGKTEEGKTDAEKKNPGKTEPDKKTTGLLRPQQTFWVGLNAADDEELLAQVDSSAKTPDAKTAGKEGPAKDASANDAPSKDASPKSSAAEAEPAKKAAADLPPTAQFELTFVDKISHTTVESAVRRAAGDAKLPQALIDAITINNPGRVPGVNESFETWTVSIPASDSTARSVLDGANTMLQAEPLFPATNNFGSLVSKKMQVDAIVAIVASWIGMLVYLWIRFQKVSFGVAAVVALIHDVLISLAFMAFSLWIAKLGIPFIDPFKIDLNVVAAFLTLIGYSVNDTIVIFDRVREIKGKSPDITPAMVNRALNETLARNVIIASLTFIVVLTQFFFGGQSIHAFTFCLVIGFIAGTYSSLYISPVVLLWLSKPSKKSGQVLTAPSRESELVA
jgi:SecD/SecF fusion protein